jgi:hypothetical protein
MSVSLTTYVVNTYLRCLRAWGLVFAQKLSKDGLPDYHEVPARAWSQHCYAFGALRMSAAHLPNDSQFANHAGAPARVGPALPQLPQVVALVGLPRAWGHDWYAKPPWRMSMDAHGGRHGSDWWRQQRGASRERLCQSHAGCGAGWMAPSVPVDGRARCQHALQHAGTQSRLLRNCQQTCLLLPCCRTDGFHNCSAFCL